MAEPSSPYEPQRAQRTLFGALLHARGAHGGSRAILVDGDGRILTYRDIVRAALRSAAVKRALIPDASLLQ